jgi:hypothetical protein
MSGAYLTASELADLIGCEPNSYACMCRWLSRNEYPYVKNVRGFPKVLRAYHEARMHGQSPALGDSATELEPDFSMFH